MSHSAAPWHLMPDSFVMSGRVGVAKIITSTREFPANGKLIEAAPELLEALVELLAAGDFWLATDDDLKATLRLGEAERAARAAIHKATGQ